LNFLNSSVLLFSYTTPNCFIDDSNVDTDDFRCATTFLGVLFYSIWRLWERATLGLG